MKRNTIEKNAVIRSKKEAGITLVALVVTIVVLLILAGISLNMVLGENGITKKAQEGSSKTGIEQAREQVEMLVADGQMDDMFEGKSLISYLQDKIGTEIDGVEQNGDEYDIEVNGYVVTIDSSGTITGDPTKAGVRPQISDIKIGTYVNYNVTYTDMYTSYEFTANDGWRVLDPGTDNGDGTYTGVKLISTGIPAKLYYYHTDVSSAPWAGTAEQITNYASKFYATSSPTNYNMYAAAGLYYNFGKIVFNYGTSTSTHNTGLFTNVNGKTSGTLTETAFLTNGEAKVHNLTMYELNEARNKKAGATTYALNQTDGTSSCSKITTSNDAATGLFDLRGLAGKYNYTTSSTQCYWLASPHSGNTCYMLYVFCGGYFSNNYNSAYGVRPVVSLPSNFTLEITGN